MRVMMGEEILSAMISKRLGSAKEAARREFSAAEISRAIAERDAGTLSRFGTQLEEDARSGSLLQIERSLDILEKTATTNQGAHRPLVVELDQGGVEHLQRMLILIAEQETHDDSPLEINRAQRLTEKVGRIARQGILRVGGFAGFAWPIHAKLEETSPVAAKKLFDFIVDSDSRASDEKVMPSSGELEAEKSAKTIASTKLDGDIGGKKPASKTGAMLWRPSARTRSYPLPPQPPEPTG